VSSDSWQAAQNCYELIKLKRLFLNVLEERVLPQRHPSKLYKADDNDQNLPAFHIHTQSLPKQFNTYAQHSQRPIAVGSSCHNLQVGGPQQSHLEELQFRLQGAVYQNGTPLLFPG
jgi:hypothetical protein